MRWSSRTSSGGLSWRQPRPCRVTLLKGCHLRCARKLRVAWTTRVQLFELLDPPVFIEAPISFGSFGPLLLTALGVVFPSPARLTILVPPRGRCQHQIPPVLRARYEGIFYGGDLSIQLPFPLPLHRE